MVDLYGHYLAMAMKTIWPLVQIVYDDAKISFTSYEYFLFYNIVECDITSQNSASTLAIPQSPSTLGPKEIAKR